MEVGILGKYKHRSWNTWETQIEVGTLRRHTHISRRLGRKIEKSEPLGDTHKFGTLGKLKHRNRKSWETNTEVGTLMRQTHRCRNTWETQT
jgi:hypothetical protein